MIIRDLPVAEYFARPEISNSFLGLVRKAPALAKAYLDGTYQRDETPSMRLGTLVHTLVLEPEAFGLRYAVAPECDRRTKAGKEEFERFTAEAASREIIPREMHEQAAAMAAAIRSHNMARALLAVGESEVSVFSDLDGTPCKSRIDFIRDGGILVDLKTTSDASPDAFARSCANFGYHRQAAMYRDIARTAGIAHEDFVFVCVEQKPPYLVACYQLDAEAEEQGRREYRHALAIWRQCLDSGDYPGIANELITSISLPRWAIDTGDYQ